MAEQPADSVIANAHNLAVGRPAPGPPRFGVRVSLPPGDPFEGLLGRDWVTEHWFATAAERDQALAGLASRHAYNRVGDQPSLQLEPVER